MKKLSLSIIIFIFCLNSFSQIIKEENTISFTYDPSKAGLGLMYTSKPILELNRKYSLASSIEYIGTTEIIKVGLGLSTIIENLRFNFTPCYNIIPTNLIEEGRKTNIISLEIGAMTQLNNKFYSITFDFVNLKPKIGLGIVF